MSIIFLKLLFCTFLHSFIAKGLFCSQIPQYYKSRNHVKLHAKMMKSVCRDIGPILDQKYMSQDTSTI